MKAKAKAKPKAQPEEGTLPPVPKQAWMDVRYQLACLEKAGNSSLKKSFQTCQSQQAKRRWYYNIFLLDPAISKKEVHKESMEKASTENTVSRGWITKWKVGELEGANPQAPDFEELCDGAVEGLEWKEHRNQSWRRKGVKLYWYEGQGMEVEKVKNQPLTKSSRVWSLMQTTLQRWKAALQPGEGQLVLGNKSSGSRGSGDPPKPKPGDGLHVPTPEEVEAEARRLASLKKAIQTLSSSVDQRAVLKGSLSSLPNVSDATVQTHLACLDAGLKKYGDAKGGNSWPTLQRPSLEKAQLLWHSWRRKKLCVRVT